MADALSRNKLDMARSLMQGSETKPVDVPKDLIELLTKEERCWSEREWSRLRSICSGRD